MNTYEQFASDHRRISEQNRRELAEIIARRAQAEANRRTAKSCPSSSQSR